MEELAYHEVGNDRIAGVFHFASGSDRRLVVMAHGFKGSKIDPSRYFVTLARELALRGIAPQEAYTGQRQHGIVAHARTAPVRRIGEVEVAESRVPNA